MSTETRRLHIAGKLTVPVDDTLSVEGAAADAKQTGVRLSNIEKDVADLMYNPISITSLTNNVNTVEIGTTITAVTFAWGFNKKPTSATFDGESVDTNSAGITKTGLSITSDKSWTLTATDERGAKASKSTGAKASKSTGVTFLHGVYYGSLADGATIDSAAILSLNKKIQNGRTVTFTVSPTDPVRIVYAIPTTGYGTPTFKDANTGFQVDMYRLEDPIEFTNTHGHIAPYYVWLSTNPMKKEVRVAVT